MKIFWQIVKRHPISIAIYLLYISFAYLVIIAKWRFTRALPQIHGGEKLAWGEGVMYGILFLSFTAILFASIILIFSCFDKGPKKFYWWLLLAIIMPIALWFSI
ncbi:hypothetical protein FO440_07975 [Mucilaginibacter corticis]|uniref:Uncharacterized protein n=1 Tax=Mucilaginibacter corticis TaxID=2597670 RepID=A0A556MVZ3_9SPHI|nr:hypothetical protein [Mucilaginibacter corticis]TSJ44100.1 hypothetical protein FO440_07975 [Mucilaginibacter corticis]